MASILSSPRLRTLAQAGRAILSLVLAVGMVAPPAFADPAPTDKPPTYPDWWFQWNVIVQSTQPPAASPSWLTDYPKADDYAVVNLGQLKAMATAAYDELQAHFPGGAGATATTLVKSWFLTDGSGNFLPDLQGQRQPKIVSETDDFTAANLGQLKAVAKLFYDALIARNYVSAYPWAEGVADDFALANLGQLKRLFSFDIAMDSEDDGQGNGLADWWELRYFGHTGVDPNADADGDGFTNGDEYQNGTDPNDLYNGMVPVLTIVSGNDQRGYPRLYLPQPLVVEVRNDAGGLLVDAPVSFTVSSGAGSISPTNGGSTTQSLQLRTDAHGQAQVWFYTGDRGGATSVMAKPDFSPRAVPKTFVETTIGIPNQPDFFDAELREDGSYYLSWVDRADNETGYKLFLSLDGGDTWANVASYGANTTSATVPPNSGSSSGGSMWEMRSENEAGQSPGKLDDASAIRDDDNDGLENAEELAEGTGFKNPDSDGDGVLDGKDISPLDPELTQPRVPETRYAVIDLTKLGLDANDAILKVNDKGQAIVTSGEGYFFFDPATTDSHRVKIPMYLVTDLNNEGTVVGLSEDDYSLVTWKSDGSGLAFYTGYSTPPLEDGHYLEQPISAYASGINDSGVMVGWTSATVKNLDGNEVTLFGSGTLWGGSNPELVGQMNLYNVPAVQAAYPADLNNSGEIVGFLWDGGLNEAFYANGSITKLPQPPGVHHTRAVGINNSAMIYGTTDTIQPVMWAPGATEGFALKTFGKFDPATQKTAPVSGSVNGVSDLNEFVGSFWEENAESAGHLWQNGKITNLKGRLSDGWQLESANAISSSGLIAGTGKFVDPAGQSPPAVNTNAQPTPVVKPAFFGKFELGVDRNMSGRIDLSDNKQKTAPKGLIIDINNEANGGPRRNADSTLDPDEKNNRSSFENSRRVEELRLTASGFDISERKIVLRITDGGGYNLRVFDDRLPAVAVHGPSKGTAYELTAMQMSQIHNGISFWMEGIEAGEVDLTLELWDLNYYSEKPLDTDTVHVEVNADRPPIPDSNRPRVSARWRARALKGISNIRSFQATIDSLEPLVTWHPQKLRVQGTSVSFWVGMDVFPASGLQTDTWAQAGQYRRVPDSALPNEAGSVAYAEIAFSYTLSNNMQYPQYYKKRGSPIREIPAAKEANWLNGDFRIEYQVNASNPLNDRLIAHVPGTTSALIDYQGRAAGFQGPEVNWRTVNFTQLQAGFESSASVARLPGTPNRHGKITGISVQNGTGTSLSGWSTAVLNNTDLQIVGVDENGGEVMRDRKSYGHYNIGLSGSSGIEVWDKYNWQEKDPENW